MPKTKLQKQEILRDLSNKIDKAKSVVFAKFDGLEVKDNEELRKKLKETNSEYYVAKKTLMSLAFKENKNMPEVAVGELEGKIAAVFGYEDEVAPAKTIAEFKKDHEEAVDFAGGILENRFISAEEVLALSKLPSRDELYAKIVGSINAPVSGFVNALAGNLRNLVYVLKAVETKKQ